MKLKRWLIFSLAFFLPIMVNAEEGKLEKVAGSVKYFKTVTILSNSEVMRNSNLGEVSSITTEITEEEYNNVDVSAANNNSRGLVTETTETTYKRLGVDMYKYNSYYYHYTATLDWKLIPSTRSYDIIGLGFIANVRTVSMIDFTQEYCRSSSECYETTSYWADSFDNGAAAMFKVPSGTLTSLNQRLDIDVEKVDENSTIYNQIVVADYSHATRSISYENAQKFYVDTGGITLNSSIEDYYDDIAEAQATWTGTW